MAVPGKPVLKPALRRLWRDRATLQLGIGRRHAVVIAGVDRTDAALLDLLDGSRDRASILADAEDRGVPADRAHRLLDLLGHAGALDDVASLDFARAPNVAADGANRANSANSAEQRGLAALTGTDRHRLAPDLLSLSLLHRDAGAAVETLRRRRSAAIVVYGAGRVGATVATLLGAAGIGSVDCVDPAPVRYADLSPAGLTEPTVEPRGAAVAAAVRRTTPATAGTDPRGVATLAIVAPATDTPGPETLAAVRALPHLTVTVRETTGCVGPFVVPGATPCDRCVELARGDRDPAWPALAAQLVTERPGTTPCDVVLATLTASLAALEALQWVDSGGAQLPPTAQGLLEYDLAEGRLRRRSLSPHLACGCEAAGSAGTMDE